ncbi:class I adenylate-forming enzyme family protein [Burkholderia multivorans]|uniref:class I adenylate-forming enzyme family protein n=1 Tax=Burkholderia multivorans TaxID=87883 RepID=UPI00057FEDFF|nr:AMP-binding protein [Burkholderia multivorans]KHS10829.1 AMP-binding protein [Burkholderia multivorans]KHS17913.1 AMP-binding protein [Burkholderia multivorans]MBR7925906.1 AMP-binding protein [Burkholderia multivorans]MBR8104202.1 AMP-binding protein [Burkholderia multivorans]MBR8341771.1 AMP-binding protein [Burkholderia multivorans]
MTSSIRSPEPDVDALLAALPPRIADVPARWAAQAPERAALIEDARRLSYAELARAVDAVASRLAALGVRGGDRVMIVAENSVAQVVLLFAAARIDAWALVSNARLSAAELDAIAAHARPKLTAFVTDTSPDARAHAARHEAVRADALPVDIGAWSYRLDAHAGSEPVAADGAAQCAALIYTTGTTGTPKGVMLSHRNLLFIAAMSSTLRRVSPDDIVYAVLPVSHVYGLASVCLGSLYAGATLRLAPRFSPEAVRVALADERVTIFQGVPAMHAKLIEHLHTHGHAWHAPRLRFAYSGGSPLDAALKARVERVYGIPLHNGYGMTESSPTITQTPLDAPRADCSVGMPIPGIEMRIVGPDGADVPRGEVGEIRVRGPNVMLGYYRNVDATRAAVSPDGWLSTGDLARQDADGAVTIVGRSKELIIRSGFNVYPVEVEQVLNAHPDVVQAAVIGRPVEGNEEVLAFVELAPGATATDATLHAWCTERLAPYKRPARIRVLDALPAASTGKVLKHKLRELG